MEPFFSKFSNKERVGVSIIEEIKQNNIPIEQAKPKVTIGVILDIIRDAKPIIVVIVESKIAIPVDLSIFSIFSILFCVGPSSANLFIIWIE